MTRVLVFLGLFFVAASATAGEEILVNDRAKESYRTQYVTGRMHKAFAQSPKGDWGCAWGKKSAQIAIDKALANCRKHLTPEEPDCVLINIDGQWL